jgi:hypothetical protein
MRGGLGYAEAMYMSAGERDLVADLIKRQIKSAKNNSQVVMAL